MGVKLLGCDAVDSVAFCSKSRTTLVVEALADSQNVEKRKP